MYYKKEGLIGAINYNYWTANNEVVVLVEILVCPFPLLLFDLCVLLLVIGFNQINTLIYNNNIDVLDEEESNVKAIMNGE